MSIIDIQPRWSNAVQDITDGSLIALDNTTIIYHDDGSQTDAAPSDTLAWEWSVIANDGSKTVLTDAFEVLPDQHRLNLCNGIFRLRCQVTDPATGRIWARTEPTEVIYTNSEVNICPVLFVPVAGYTPAKWRENAGKHMSFGGASHYFGQHFVGGVVNPGDVDGNKVVNFADVNIVLTNYGKTY